MIIEPDSDHVRTIRAERQCSVQAAKDEVLRSQLTVALMEARDGDRDKLIDVLETLVHHIRLY